MKPMLAKVYAQRYATYPAFVQPKLNGIRGLWLKTYMLSRGRPGEEGKQWMPEVLPYIYHELQLLNIPFALDGELYHHGMSLQQINSRVAVNRIQPHDDISSIEYHIFDILTSEPMSARIARLEHIKHKIELLGLTHVVVVETQTVENENEFNLAHKMFRRLNYEGTMYRKYDAPYGFTQNCSNKENRWTTLLKRKDALDMECKIIDVIESEEGQFKGVCGSLHLETPEGIKFYSGSGLDPEQRVAIWKVKDKLTGVHVRINFDELSDAGVPVRNRIESIDYPLC